MMGHSHMSGIRQIYSLGVCPCFWRFRSARRELVASFLACCSGSGGAFMTSETAYSNVRVGCDLDVPSVRLAMNDLPLGD